MSANEARHKRRPWLIIHLAWRPILLNISVLHDDNQVCERQGFFLTVGDMNKGDAKFGLETFQFIAHTGAQKRVKGRGRLIQQQDTEMGDQGACQCYTLLLSPRELRWPAVRVGFHMDQT